MDFNNSRFRDDVAFRKGGMMTREVKIHGVYRHFKGKMYIVEDVACHSETLEKMVIYRALYGDGELWCRPYELFVEKLDKKKYPEAKQEYRFELWEVDGGL